MMKTVCLDTSHRTLTIALIEDDEIVYGFQKDAFKAQSETIMVELDLAFKTVGWIPKQMEAMVITDGPGSYTGIRIAMTIAKVICAQANLPLYTLSSLQLLAGVKNKTCALMDARGHRAYVGMYQYGSPLFDDCVIPLTEIDALLDEGTAIVGDAGLISKPMHSSDLPRNFLDLKAFWKRVENIHTLQPRYLKESEIYLKP
jgi:tRNA threonylcarbamoyl adenosine modification protein YeaZ